MPNLASLLMCMFVFAGVASPALVLAGFLPLVFVLVNLVGLAGPLQP